MAGRGDAALPSEHPRRELPGRAPRRKDSRLGRSRLLRGARPALPPRVDLRAERAWPGRRHLALLSLRASGRRGVEADGQEAAGDALARLAPVPRPDARRVEL